MPAKIKKNVVEKFGVIGEENSKMTKQLTRTEWGVYEARFDIRSWDENYDKCSKGIGFSAKELIKLRELLNSIDLESYEERESDE